MDNSELPGLHERALAHTRRYVERITEDQWDLGTPCHDWNVRQMVNHIVAGNLWVGELGRGRTIADVGDRLDGDVLNADVLAAYDESARAAQEAFDAPGAMTAPCAVSYGPIPGAMYAGHRLIDVFIHGWDLAVATGQDTALDPELVEACWIIAEPQADLLAGSGGFATDVEADPGADLQTRLLALLGRRAI